MSFLSRLIQRNFNSSSVAISGRPGFFSPGFDNVTIGENIPANQTQNGPMGQTHSPPGIQRQGLPETQDQPEDQVARSPSEDKPAVDTKPRTPDEKLEETESPAPPEVQRKEAAGQKGLLLPQTIRRVENPPSFEEKSEEPVQRFADVPLGEEKLEETVQRASDEAGVVEEPEESPGDAVISRQADPTIQRKATAAPLPRAPSTLPGVPRRTDPDIPQKPTAAPLQRGPSKRPFAKAVKIPSENKPPFAGKSEKPPEALKAEKAKISAGEPVLDQREFTGPEETENLAVPVPDTREIFPGVFQGPDKGSGAGAPNREAKEKPTVIIERIDIHVSDDQGGSKKPQDDPLATPLDAYYLRSL